MSAEATEKPFEALLCSDCLHDYGLSFDAHTIGVDFDTACPHCGSASGRKLDRGRLIALADTFFVRGTLVRGEYGAAPVLQFNEHHRKTDIDVDERLRKDAELLGEAAGVGFFHYGPRLWMLGEVEPLKALHDASTRDGVVERTLKEFPERTLAPDQRLVRPRRTPYNPRNHRSTMRVLVGREAAAVPARRTFRPRCPGCEDAVQDDNDLDDWASNDRAL